MEPYRSSSTRTLDSLRCLYCGASHQPSDTVCGACKSDVGRVRCRGCGNGIAAGEASCACGSPVPRAAAHGTMECPRCHGALKDLSLKAPGVVVHECERCHGTFLDVHDWNDLADRAAAGEHLPIGHFVPLPPGEELPRQALLAEVSCPDCRAPMERVTFGVRSRTVVDVCKLHGLWLDAGELVAVLAFVKSREETGGQLPLSDAEKEENVAFDRKLANAESANLALRVASARLEETLTHNYRARFSYAELVAAVRRSPV